MPCPLCGYSKDSLLIEIGKIKSERDEALKHAEELLAENGRVTERLGIATARGDQAVALLREARPYVDQAAAADESDDVREADDTLHRIDSFTACQPAEGQ